jgi:hypothetical protein
VRPSLGDFTAPTPLAAEHRRLMDGSHRPIDWTRSTAKALPAPLRAHLARAWRARMISEHRAVGIFQLYGLDLLAAGAPAEVLSACCRAALDEVRHAELFARLTTCYSGELETPPPGIPPLSEDPTISLAHQVMREALHLSVGSETFSAVLLAEKLERAQDPVVRDVLGVVLADELHHARMGWAFLATLVGADSAAASGARSFLNGELGPLLDDLEAAMFGNPVDLGEPSLPPADEAAAIGHGYTPRRDEYRLFTAALHEVWIPGFAGLGLDTAGLAGRSFGAAD